MQYIIVTTRHFQRGADVPIRQGCLSVFCVAPFIPKMSFQVSGYTQVDVHASKYIFPCSYTSRLRVTESLHRGIFANATLGGRERVFWGRECSRPGLQDGSHVLEEPSRFSCAFMRARKSFHFFFSFNPTILQRTAGLMPQMCEPVTKPITYRLKLDMAPSRTGMSLLFYVTQQDGNNGK